MFWAWNCNKVYISVPSPIMEAYQTDEDPLSWKVDTHYCSLVGAMSFLSVFVQILASLSQFCHGFYLTHAIMTKFYPSTNALYFRHSELGILLLIFYKFNKFFICHVYWRWVWWRYPYEPLEYRICFTIDDTVMLWGATVRPSLNCPAAKLSKTHYQDEWKSLLDGVSYSSNFLCKVTGSRNRGPWWCYSRTFWQLHCGKTHMGAARISKNKTHWSPSFFTYIT